jgi:hypothetical protein
MKSETTEQKSLKSMFLCVKIEAIYSRIFKNFNPKITASP